MANVSLLQTGVSINGVAVSLASGTVELACIGPALMIPNNVSLITFNPSTTPPAVVFNFSLATSSMYLPLMGGFA